MTSVVVTGVTLGIGLMGALDEIIFHQMLQWHNFYVDTTQYWRIFSDGAFHVFTTTMLFLGAMRLWSQRRRLSSVISGQPFWSGLLMGIGGFQLFDGIVNHKILKLHPVREGVENIWAYDLAWNIPAAVILLAGWLLWHRLRAEATVTPAPPDDAQARRPARTGRS
ncbi:MAG: DUF2243 domain-containing protein [Chloroflexota bacterium]